MSSILKVNTIQDGGGNAIITSDGSGNLTTQNILTPAFEVTMASEQNPSDSTFTKIGFDTVTFDTASAFSTTNNRFTVPSNTDGKYYIWANSTLGSNTNSDVIDAYLAIYKNGSVHKRSYVDSRNNNTRYAQLSVLSTMQLVAGDYIEIFGRVNVSSGTVEIRVQDGETTFGGYRIGS